MIKDENDSEENNEVDEGEGSLNLLRYQGTFEGLEGSGLHIAIRYGQEDVAWLLLALASSLDWQKFPVAMLQAMESFGVSPADRVLGCDVRNLTDSEGRTPNGLAQLLGGKWRSWVDAGRFGP